PATVTALRTEARRLNRILSDFLRFARPQEARRAPADIRDVVQHVGALIREDRSRGARVDVKVAVDPAVPRFAFDRDQLTQVLWNVALNGVQAMNGSGLGLTIAERIVTAHGGRIDIDAAPGGGTRVTMRFPIEAA